MGENLYSLAFFLAPGIGPKRFQNLLRIFGSAKKAWQGNSADFRKAGVGKRAFAKFDAFRKEFRPEQYLEKLQKARVEFVEYGSTYYPLSLKKLPDPPIGLFVKGNKKLLVIATPPERGKQAPAIAVVGARKITSYGRQVTENLVSALCSAGFVIVSGMALGVDGVAHQSAIQAEGRTLAVLGCGVDCPYPKENERLYEEILDSQGLIVSEYWLGTHASQGTFPARNRIIAGISSSVLITEAAQDSGSLITAQHAVEQGKKVFAVPGPINSRMSDGTAKLIKQGAVLVTSTNDILEDLKVKSPADAKALAGRQNSKVSNFSMEQKKILEVLESEERTIDEIAKLTKIPIAKLSMILSEMELSGLIKNIGGKFATTSI